MLLQRGKYIFAVLLWVWIAVMMSACSVILPKSEPKSTYYEATLEFYVNPIRNEENWSQPNVYGAYAKHVMEAMVKLLSSDDFEGKLVEQAAGAPVRFDENGEVTQAFQDWLQSEQGKTWRANLQYISYSYATEEDSLNRIYTTVSVPQEQGREVAEGLLEILPQAVIQFVQENMMVPSGYTGTRCTLLTQSYEIQEIEK